MKDYILSESVANMIFNALSYYADDTSYDAPRIGGVLAGCPRGEAPHPEELSANARMALNAWLREMGRETYFDDPDQILDNSYINIKYENMKLRKAIEEVLSMMKYENNLEALNRVAIRHILEESIKDQ